MVQTHQEGVVWKSLGHGHFSRPRMNNMDGTAGNGKCGVIRPYDTFDLEQCHTLRHGIFSKTTGSRANITI